ncbi:MAG: nucleotidyltransferase substrate binding protein [Proteobacteria bacterium]|nr:nucleotidyltransferase substrate binding protein [Pseudomonadota bacterium]MBU1696176.1 nucleotidyltransferase substrate binding protein [Pseudomonadota bacterium]
MLKADLLHLLIINPKWMDMIQSRNLTSHTYNEDTAGQICKAVTQKYFTLFEQLIMKMDTLLK